jgi:hypothetical protein
MTCERIRCRCNEEVIKKSSAIFLTVSATKASERKAIGSLQSISTNCLMFGLSFELQYG